MISFDLIRELAQPTPSKIVLLVMDGLGGLPDPQTGRTELETAHTPNLDRVAAESICGLAQPVGPGISPGSGPGHLALFGAASVWLTYPYLQLAVEDLQAEKWEPEPGRRLSSGGSPEA